MRPRNLFSDLFTHSLLVISGKGGTGKSLISAALAQAASERGKRVLVVEAAAQSQLSSLLRNEPDLGHAETYLRPGVWGINVSPQECFREYIGTHLGLPRLYDTVFRHSTVQSFINAIPGLGESMILGRLMYTCTLQAPAKYDLVIFDAPASGHFLSMMQTPSTIIDALRIGPLVRELHKIRDFLSDPLLSAGLFVTTSEELVVSETLEFLPLLRRSIPLTLKGVVISKAAALNIPQEEEDEAYRTFSARYPELSSVLHYAQEKTASSREQERLLRETLQKNYPDLALAIIPDCGPLNEPLDSATVASLFSRLETEHD
jgi:anion-transporting  ArsA/GET3 family ATPase